MFINENRYCAGCLKLFSIGKLYFTDFFLASSFFLCLLFVFFD